VNVWNSRDNGLLVLHPFYPVMVHQLLAYVKSPGRVRAAAALNRDLFSMESVLKYTGEEAIDALVGSLSVDDAAGDVNKIVTKQESDRWNIWWYILAAISLVLIAEYVLVMIR